MLFSKTEYWDRPAVPALLIVVLTLCAVHPYHITVTDQHRLDEGIR